MYKATTKFAFINYADDTTLVSTVETFDTNGQEHQLNNNTNKKLASYMISYLHKIISKLIYMMFNMPQKQVPVLKISICNKNIDIVDNVNILGLILDKNLKWNCHIQKNCE